MWQDNKKAIVDYAPSGGMRANMPDLGPTPMPIPQRKAKIGATPGAHGKLAATLDVEKMKDDASDE
jgi:hypothetical protein